MEKRYMPVKRISFFISFLFFLLQGSAQTYLVNSIADDGSAGTLRDAINKVNTGVFNTINFNFSALGPAPYTITLSSALPTIQPGASGPIVINGYSEPASSAGTIDSRVISVLINGNNVATNAFIIGYSGVHISGLAIYRCQQSGISILEGINNTFIWGNFIGTDNTGLTTSIGNAVAGVYAGTFLSTVGNSRLIIGTDGNGVNDVQEGNLIVNNGSGGDAEGGIIAINTSDSRFSGNIIGLGKDGVSKTNLYNDGVGVGLFDRSGADTIGTNGDGIADALERNFISNNSRGVWINAKSNGNMIANNVIGLDNVGGNAGNLIGIIIDNSSNCLIGTNADGTSDALEKNFISASLGDVGILIKSGNLGPAYDQNSNNNKIAGNSIGVSLDNITPAGNVGHGILLQALGTFTTSNNIIGSDGNGINESVKGNIIANHSFYDAIRLDDLSNSNLVIGNRISKNSIYGNGGAGINLLNPATIAGTGITANHPAGFSTTGPNNLLNFPVITSITSDFQNITFSGFARPGALIEFYVADKSATVPTPPAGLTKNFGQGRTFLFQAKQGGTLNGITDIGTNTPGSYTITDEGTTSGISPVSADYSFTFTVNAASIGIIGGPILSFSALAIDAGNTSGNVNNTSSFSGNVDANLVSLPVTFIDFSGRVAEGKAFLQWSTSEEFNNHSFDIEKSTSGTSFSKIGNVSANRGTGGTIKKYNFTDDHLAGNINFYRLKQVDTDGKFSYSKVITLRTELSDNSVKIFPSPFKNNINISVNALTNEKLDVHIIDQSGRTVKQYSMQVSPGINSFNISNLSDLTPGTYVIRLKGKTTYYQHKLVKN
jgi:hypothetical protein